mgnify:CR=1 FL=1
MQATMAKGEIGKLIRESRLRAGLTQGELAKQADLTQAALSHIESGRSEPTISTLKRIAIALGISWKDLIPE